MRFYLRGVAWGLTAAFCLTGAGNAGASVARPLPNEDAFLASSRRLPVEPPASVAGKLNLGKAIQAEPRLGVPTFVWTRGTKAQLPAGMLTPGKEQAVAAARTVLSDLAPLYGLQGSDLSSATLYEVTDPGRAPITVSFKRQIDGIEVFRDRIVVVMSKDLTPVAVSGYLPASVKGIATPARFVKTPEAMAVSAIADLTGVALPASSLKDSGRQNGAYRYFELAGPAAVSLATPVRWKKTVYHLPERLIPAYYLEVDIPDDSGSPMLWAYVLSAEDGTLLHRGSLTQYDSFSYRVWGQTSGTFRPDDGPQGTAQSPHPTGNSDGTALSYVAPSLLTLQNGPISTNDPWLPAGATETTGNNVDAYADLVTPSGFNAGDLRASVTAPGVFDRVYDVAQAPGASAAQQMAAVTQLFYLNNFLHDWFYDVGFNEAAGNAQTNNFGRGGLGGDPIQAEGQDFGGTNNANMSTPADGGSPRMQMYVFSGKSPRQVFVSGTPYLANVSTTFGAQTFDVTAPVVLNNDGSGAPTLGCVASAAGAYAGKIVVIDRGTCNYTVKVKNAQNAGAVGVIVANNAAGAGAVGMGGTDATVTIGALSVSLEDGVTIKTALPAASGRILRSGAGVGPDGTIDNGISGHEWGHYLSNRLVPGLGGTQSGGMGEGWGDFIGLLLLRRQGEALNGVYASGAYAPQGMSIDSLYYGIRRYPYSTNFNKSPLTFKHITTGQALPVGPPRDSAIASADNAEVHNSGEVWCAMLWEAYSELLAATEGGSPRLTFDQAQDRMRTYLVAGLKATPGDPTFTEARDAMLAVAAAADAQDFVAFCNAFSRRGIGTGAVSPDRASTTNAGVVESFVCGGDLVYVSASVDDSVMNCDSDGILDKGEKGLLHVSVKNSGGTALSGTTASISSTNPMVVFPSGNSINFPASAVGQTVNGTVQVVLNGSATGLQGMDFAISYTDPGLYVPGPRLASYLIAGNANNLPASSASDDVESPTPAWTATGTGGSPWTRVADTALAHHWHGPDNGSTSDIVLVSPPLQVAAAGSFSFTFQHRYQFEFSSATYWDGGVLEITTNGGGSWTDIGASAVPGYVGTIDSTAGNPLAGRLAYANASAGYPAYVPVTVNLGTAYQGQTVQLRFRAGSDQNTSAAGWDIDNIVFTGITNTPFPTFVAQTTCTVLPVELQSFEID